LACFAVAFDEAGTLYSFGECSLLGRACDASNYYTPSAVNALMGLNGFPKPSTDLITGIAATDAVTMVVAGTNNGVFVVQRVTV
jgi:hypothetical protein